jgi:hypothetical protein
MDKQIFELTRRNSLLYDIEQSPDERSMGGNEINEDGDKIRLYIGTNPVVINLKEFYEKTGKNIPDEIQLFKGYKLYLLSHSVGIIKDGGLKKVSQVGYRMEFEEGSQVKVNDLLPQSDYIKTIGGKFSLEAGLSIDGSLSIPTEVTEYLSEIEWVGLGGKLQATTNTSLIGNLSFATYSNKIAAIGKNSNYSEWQIKQTDEPLHGRDINMYQIIIVDMVVKKIKYRCKANINISSWMGLDTVRRETDWVNIQVLLT